jgi:aminopeptidase N
VEGASDRRDFRLPGAPTHWPPDRLVNTRHILLELNVVPEKHSLRGTVTHFLTAIDKPVSRIPFHLEELTVDAVKVGGRETRFHHEDGVLEVFLSPAAQPGREVEVSITYHGSPRTGLNFTAPDRQYPGRPYQAWSQGQDEYSRFWWPSHDFPNQRATTEMVVTAPGKYEVVSNGRLVSVSKNRDMRIWHWIQEIPHVAYLVSLVVGEFEHWTDEADGGPREYYVPPGRRKDGERTFASTAEMVRVFEEFTGQKYPYAKYAQVVVQDFTWGGMENTSATTLADVILHDERSVGDYDTDSLLAHELGHQWFGDLVTCREWAHAWLNEGFASYCEYVWDEEHLGADEAQQTRIEDLEAYLGEDATYRRPLVVRTYHEPFELFDIHLYEKGAWVLWMLRMVVGDDTFHRAVHAYMDRHREGLVETSDLIRAFEDVSGKSLGWFFDQWVYGAGHPEFEVVYTWDEDGGIARLAVKQTQKPEGDVGVFRMPVLVAFGQPGRKQPIVEEIEVGSKGEAEEGFSFSLPRRATWVRFDYGNQVLKSLKFDRAEQLLINQLHEDEMSGRVEAARALGRKGGPAAVDALAEALRKDPFWAVQAAAARAALLQGLAHAHNKVRAAVASALGAWRGDEEVGRALAGALQRDKSYLVAAAAAAALGKTRARVAANELKRALQRESYREVIRAGALAGLAALEDERQLPLILEMARPGSPARIRQVALVRAAELATALPQEQRRAVRDAAEEALRDPLYFVRRGAVEALAKLADRSAIEPLEALVDREVEGAIRHEARVAIERLRQGTTQEEAIKSLREDIEKLRREENELRQRLDKAEARAGIKPAAKPKAVSPRPKTRARATRTTSIRGRTKATPRRAKATPAKRAAAVASRSGASRATRSTPAKPTAKTRRR